MAVGERSVWLQVGKSWNDELNPARALRPPTARYLAALWDTDQMLIAGRSGWLARGRRPTPNSFGYDWENLSQWSRAWLWDVGVGTVKSTNVTPSFSNGEVVLNETVLTNQFYFAAGDGWEIHQSDDGVRWLDATVPSLGDTPGSFYGVAASPDLLVAVGSEGRIAYSRSSYLPLTSTYTLTNTVGSLGSQMVTNITVTNWINTLGLVWEWGTTFTALDLQGVVFESGVWIATGADGGIYVNRDGVNWSRQQTSTHSYLSSVERSPSGWVATGDNGIILQSIDGTVWKDRSPGITNWIYRVRWLNEQWVAVGEGGIVLTSRDGLSWTVGTSGVTQWLNDVESVGGVLYVVGTQGTVLSSTNQGKIWKGLDTITGRSFYSAASMKGQLVVVGTEGSILRAQAGPWPNPVQFVEYPRHPEDHFVLFAGAVDQPFEYQRSTNVVTWPRGTEFEISDPEGILLLFDPSVNSGSNQYFRSISPPPPRLQ